MNEISKKQQCMTSLDIAAVTGKPHGDVLKAIRKMEPAWERECGGKFSCTSERVKMPQGGVRLIPVFELTKTESLYIATKFNDEARARLVDHGIQYWNGGHYKLKDAYKDSGYAQYRNFHYYGLDGEKKERSYLVWTALGMEMMRTIIK